jgi:hypothetical protein
MAAAGGGGGGKPLAGEVVVFTGFRDGGLARRVAALGGVYKDSLTKATTTVVCVDEHQLYTNKARAARDRGLRVLTRAEFEAAPAAGGGAINFADPSFLAAEGLPPAGVSADVTAARGVVPVLEPLPPPQQLLQAQQQFAPGASRFGGAPDLPSSVGWPAVGGAPLAFLAQVNLTAASLADGAGLLPRHGWLLFFAAADYAGEAGGCGGSGGGGLYGSAYGDTAAQLDAALEGADPGPREAVGLGPSRVLFLAPGARLGGPAEWPPGLPPGGSGAHRLGPPRGVASFQPGPGPEGGGGAAAGGGSSSSAAAAPPVGGAALQPQLLGPPGGAGAGALTARVLAEATQLWEDAYGGAEGAAAAAATGPASGSRKRQRPSASSAAAPAAAADPHGWVLLLQLEVPLPAAAEAAAAGSGDGGSSSTAAAPPPSRSRGGGGGIDRAAAEHSGTWGGKVRRLAPKAAAAGAKATKAAAASASSSSSTAAAAADEPESEDDDDDDDAKAASLLPARRRRLFFMIRAADLAAKLFSRHVLVSLPVP